jgi:hypothetical protein
MPFSLILWIEFPLRGHCVSGEGKECFSVWVWNVCKCVSEIRCASAGDHHQEGRRRRKRETRSRLWRQEFHSCAHYATFHAAWVTGCPSGRSHSPGPWNKIYSEVMHVIAFPRAFFFHFFIFCFCRRLNNCDAESSAFVWESKCRNRCLSIAGNMSDF